MLLTLYAVLFRDMEKLLSEYINRYHLAKVSRGHSIGIFCRQQRVTNIILVQLLRELATRPVSAIKKHLPIRNLWGIWQRDDNTSETSKFVRKLPIPSGTPYKICQRTENKITTKKFARGLPYSQSNLLTTPVENYMLEIKFKKEFKFFLNPLKQRAQGWHIFRV